MIHVFTEKMKKIPFEKQSDYIQPIMIKIVNYAKEEENAYNELIHTLQDIKHFWETYSITSSDDEQTSFEQYTFYEYFISKIQKDHEMINHKITDFQVFLETQLFNSFKI